MPAGIRGDGPPGPAPKRRSVAKAAAGAQPPSGPSYRLRRFPNGRWRIVWTAGRVTHSRSTRCQDEAGARAELARFIESRRPKARSFTVAAALADYLADRRGEVVAFARLEHGAKALHRHMGRAKVADLTPASGRRYIRARRDEGAGDGTIGRELAQLRAALRLARAEGRIRDVPSLPMPPRPPPRDRWLSRDEAGRLIAAAIEPHVRLFVILALHTAARGGAIRELRWRQLDFEAGLVDFRAAGRRKTAKGRAVVPMTDTLRAALLEARAAAEASCSTTETKPGFCLTGDAPVIAYRGRPVKSVARGVDAAARRAKLAGVTPHVFRHTSATWLAQAGVAMERIAQFLGHTNPATTARIYAKHSPDWLADAARKLDQPRQQAAAPLGGLLTAAAPQTDRSPAGGRSPKESMPGGIDGAPERLAA